MYRSISSLLLAVSSFSSSFMFMAMPLGQAAQTPETQSPRLIATGTIPGDARDLSQLAGNLEEGTPRNQIGGFSAIDFDTQSDRWIVLSDRGPADGATGYECRWHRFSLTIDREKGQIQPELLETTLLKNANQVSYTGSLAGLNQGSSHSSLDPEGIRALPDGKLLISDEYGPKFELFDRQGKSSNSWFVPDYAKLPLPATGDSRVGAVSNRGLEGLAYNASRNSIVGMMQGPLMQDSYVEGSKYFGKHVRLFAYDGKDHSLRHQWVYQLEDVSCGISEILSIGDDEYLVIERDSLVGEKAKYKRIYAINVAKATDIGQRAQLDPHSLPADIRPVSKRLLIDLLDPQYPFRGNVALTKPEGIALGPKFADGSRCLMVCVDNDFQSSVPSYFMAFAIP